MSKVYQVITDRMLALLDKGTVPWHMPWNPGLAPRGYGSSKPYRGINAFITACQSYGSPYYFTAKKCNELGGKIKKGEKATPICLWQFKDRKDPDGNIMCDDEGNPMKSVLFRYYNVFNADQIEGLDIPREKLYPEVETNDINRVELCEQVYQSMPNRPKLLARDQRAYYKPSEDLVNMPKFKSFNTPEEYYSTLFHELGHSTGHKSRLNRKSMQQVNLFGSHEYSKEELVAEMTAAFLCAECGIEQPVIENQAAYIKGWVSKLREKDNEKLIVEAAQAAQKAADFILGIKKGGDDE